MSKASHIAFARIAITCGPHAGARLMLPTSQRRLTLRNGADAARYQRTGPDTFTHEESLTQDPAEPASKGGAKTD